MLGKWLEQLTPTEEDRLLTTKLVPFTTFDGVDAGCLVGTAIGCVEHRNQVYSSSLESPLWEIERGFDQKEMPHERFNKMCCKLVGVAPLQFWGGLTPELRLGGARVAVLIRNRILRNRARRALQGVRSQQQPQRQVVGASL